MKEISKINLRNLFSVLILVVFIVGCEPAKQSQEILANDVADSGFPTIDVVNTGESTEIPTTPATQCDFSPSVEAENIGEDKTASACMANEDIQQSLYQSFLATSEQINSVTFRFRPGGSFPPDGVTLHLTLHDCQFDGPVLAQSDLFIPPTVDTGKVLSTEFIFDDPVQVTNGRQLFFQIENPVNGGKTLALVLTTNNNYPDGYYATNCMGDFSPQGEMDAVFLIN